MDTDKPARSAQDELDAALEWQQQAKDVAINAAGYLHVGAMFHSPDLAMLETQFNAAVDNLREADALVLFWRGVVAGKVDLG